MKIFATLDIDNDGDVTEEEFVQGCLKDEELVIFIIIAMTIDHDHTVRDHHHHNPYTYLRGV